MVRLVATQKLRYGTKEYQVGETFEASDKDAAVLKAIRKAADEPPEAVQKSAPLPKKINLPLPPESASVTKPTAVKAEPAPVVKEEVPVKVELPVPLKVESHVLPKVEPVEKVPESTAAPKVEVTPVESEPKQVAQPGEPPVPAAAVPISTSGRLRRADLRPEE